MEGEVIASPTLMRIPPEIGNRDIAPQDGACDTDSGVRRLVSRTRSGIAYAWSAERSDARNVLATVKVLIAIVNPNPMAIHAGMYHEMSFVCTG
jgi:hypothetical protein